MTAMMIAAAPPADGTPSDGAAVASDSCGPARIAFAIDVPDAMLEGVRHGDRAAFERLYRRFERAVHTLAVRMLVDACNDGRDDAADVLQETMLKVFRRAHEFRDEGAPFWSWVRQIAVNEALMRLRQRRRFDGEVGLDHDAFEDPAPPPPAAWSRYSAWRLTWSGSACRCACGAAGRSRPRAR